MAKRKKTRAQTISIILSFLMFGMMGFAQLTGSLQNNTNETVPANPSPIPTFQSSTFEEDTLVLNQTTTYPLLAGNIIALQYYGEVEQVVTLRLTSEDDITPPITIITQRDDNSQAVVDVVTSKDGLTVICGFTFEATGEYRFTFEAPIDSTYSVQFESGNTCDEE